MRMAVNKAGSDDVPFCVDHFIGAAGDLSDGGDAAITYPHKGRQYVTVASGLGGILATRYASLKMPTGGSIWTFALMTE